MKSNDKKKKETKKAKSDGTTTKTQSDYQKDKTRKAILEPVLFKQKK